MAGLVLVGLLAAISPAAKAEQRTIEKTAFYERAAFGCTRHPLILDFANTLPTRCDEITPSITEGYAETQQRAELDGTYDLTASAGGGSLVEHWEATATASFTPSIETPAPAGSVTVVARYRIDHAAYEVVGGADMGSFGQATSNYGAGPCGEGGVIDTDDPRERKFFEGVLPGTYELRVRYTCSDGGLIPAGRAFELYFVLIAYASSSVDWGHGTSKVQGQLLSYSITVE